jgi:hypothetical protein
MIIRVLPDNKVVKIKSIRPNEEDLFLEKNFQSGFRKVNSLPYSRYEFYKLNEDDEIVVDEERELAQLKIDKKAELKSIFIQKQRTGYFTCSLEFDVDANDVAIRNVNSLIEYLPDDTTEIQFRDKDNIFHTLKKPDLLQIKRELIEYGLALYQNKWNIEQQIEQTSSIEELDALKIEV